MAEFQEIIKIKDRMYQYYVQEFNGCCNACPLNKGNNGTNEDCFSFLCECPEEAEAIILKWANEHPVKTNKDKLMELVASAFGEAAAKDVVGHLHKCEGFKCPKVDGCASCKYENFWEKEYKEKNND